MSEEITDALRKEKKDQLFIEVQKSELKRRGELRVSDNFLRHLIDTQEAHLYALNVGVEAYLAWFKSKSVQINLHLRMKIEGTIPVELLGGNDYPVGHSKRKYVVSRLKYEISPLLAFLRLELSKDAINSHKGTMSTLQAQRVECDESMSNIIAGVEYRSKLETDELIRQLRLKLETAVLTIPIESGIKESLAKQTVDIQRFIPKKSNLFNRLKTPRQSPVIQDTPSDQRGKRQRTKLSI
jgi:hypothetical protein